MKVLGTPIPFILIVCSLWPASCACAQTWTQTAAPTNNYWWGLGCSANARTIIAATDYPSTSAHISTNSGASWTSIPAPVTYGSAVACSIDGRIIAVGGSTLFISTNSGADWTDTGLPAYAVACSGDGTKWIAGGGAVLCQLYTSTNSAVNWALSTNIWVTNWTSIISSADGIKIAAAGAPGGQIVASTNGGASWNVDSPYPYTYQYQLACSSDAGFLFAAGSSGYFFTSTNWGASWSSNTPPFFTDYDSVACSADGKKVVLGGHSFYYPSAGWVATSQDSGITWITTSAPVTNPPVVASSADGNVLIAASKWGIFRGEIPPSPVLDMSRSTTNITLSWAIPSADFVLQQSADLVKSNWSNVLDLPAMEFTNIEYCVTLPVTNHRSFYRLKH